MKSKYDLHVYWSEQDQTYIADVPDLPACKADGATYEQAVKNAQQIIEEWIETATLLGRTVPDPTSHATSQKRFA